MNDTTFVAPPENVYSLEGKGLKLTTAADIEPYLAEIRDVPTLELLQLNGNTIGPEAAKALADVLKTKSSIKVALLYDIFTGRLREDVKGAVKDICDALADKKHLVEINLSDNAFGPIGAESMFDFIVRSPALETLKLNNNGLGITGGRLIAKAMMERHARHTAAGEKSTLRCLVAGRNRLENGSSKALAEAFAAHGTFTEVRLPQNGIRPEGIRHLCLGLTHCPNLAHLDLQDNTFTAVGSLALAESLASWPHLKRLNLGDCLVGPMGGLAVAAEMLQLELNLEELLLGFNEIEENAALVLSQAVAKMTALKSLDLNGNRFDAECSAVTQIRAALQDNDNEDALGSLSDMEELTDDELDIESEASEEEEEEEEEEQKLVEGDAKAKDAAVDALADALSGELKM
ncbi:Ran GAP Rna1 [Tieghemiomyces parasiticus]|uniref:Ran GAP Rna1 n=1 Tax=Tieghemiomyces parasiticus TaxID=78921 RepID=A0A9W8ABE0_9FUNG|nr:Ran GAP Rna1 [Tieghemiomyces parasiticus]